MTIEAAYDALAEAAESALVGAQFIGPGDLRVDPEDLIEPTGNELQVLSAASLEKINTAPIRPLLGRPERRWVVERRCRIELITYGPRRTDRLQIATCAIAALSRLGSDNPTLSGACERLDLVEVEEGTIEPNGVSMVFTFTLRVRAGDPLGATP